MSAQQHMKMIAQHRMLGILCIHVQYFPLCVRFGRLPALDGFACEAIFIAAFVRHTGACLASVLCSLGKIEIEKVK
jgi:hypothetical protein